MKSNKSKIDRLTLARLLKLYSEVNTKEGLLISEDELEVGTEVFVVNDEGLLTPANDGEYHTDEATYKVESGIIVSIEKVEKPVEVPVEEPVEEPMAEEPAEEPVEEPVEEVNVDEMQAEIDRLKAENETLRAENENLHAENDTLRAENDELKAKLEEPVAEPVEEVEKKQLSKMRREERANNVSKIVSNIKKIKK